MNIDPANHTPFAPNGFVGIHQGAAIVFFAYIGFDAVSTAAEEACRVRLGQVCGVWLVIGALVYAFYGYRHSRLR
jgi:basic amino acid/polyamine antiporter, APA family